MRLAPTPMSKATNAYELLDDVARVILEEPKRVYMPAWIRDFRSTDQVNRGGPACGTVGCIAGWCRILTRPGQRSMGSLYDLSGTTMAHVATLLFGENVTNLGVDPRDRAYEQLVSPELWDKNGELAFYKPNTREYARAVVRKIRKFQKAWAPTLKAQKIPTRGK